MVHYLAMQLTYIKRNLPEMGWGVWEMVSVRVHCRQISLCFALVCSFGGGVLVFVTSLVCFIMSSIFKYILCILFPCFYDISNRFRCIYFD